MRERGREGERVYTGVSISYYHISFFKRHGVYLISGTFRCGVYKRAGSILKITIKENEIMCQVKTIRYFLNNPV